MGEECLTDGTVLPHHLMRLLRSDSGVSRCTRSGYVYEPEFLSEAEEAALMERIQTLPLQEAEYKQFRAKRRIKSYGGRYDYSANRLLEAEPIAAFLHPLRERVANWTGRSAGHFAQALVAEYAP